MFDNLNNKIGSAPAAPVEDIFSTVETAPRVNSGSEASAAPATRFSQAVPWETSTFSKKWLWLVLILLLVVAGAGAAYLWWPRAVSQPETKSAALGTATNSPTDNSLATIPQPDSETAKDSDGDGLTDDEERGLGTDPYLIDTDKDGLTDREEVKVYKTNPLNPDTDGDGYSDGEEVKNGYNPLGQGKLLQLPGNVNQ